MKAIYDVFYVYWPPFKLKYGSVVSYCTDNTRAKNLLDWSPKVNLDDGLKKVFKPIKTLGNSEGLDAHVKSVSIRFSKE